MSIWKKFASMLFEETDADVIAEDELESVSFSEEKVNKKVNTPPKREEIVNKEETKQNEAFVMEKTVVQEEPKKFVSIEITEEKPKQKEKDVPVTSSLKRNISISHEEKKDFEFTPVISPMFGSKEENAKPKKSSMSITLPKPKKANPLGTVISPYYGVNELEEFEAEAQETIGKKEKVKHEELPSKEIETFEEDEDVNSLSLDDLIMDNDVEDEEEDMMQISLFGESTPIRDCDNEIED